MTFSRSLSVFAIALLASSISAFAMGCSDSVPGTSGTGTGTGTGSNAGNNPNAGPVPQGFELTCNASISAMTADYEITGSTLTVSTPAGSQQLTRVGGSGGLVGTWSLPTPKIDGDPATIAKMGLTIQAKVVVTGSTITNTVDCGSNWATIHATASSPITMTDASLSILETHAQARRWTQAGGDQVTSSMAIHPFGEAPEATTATIERAVLGASFPSL